MAFPLPNPNSPGPGNEGEFEGLVANLFRRYGWWGKKGAFHRRQGRRLCRRAATIATSLKSRPPQRAAGSARALTLAAIHQARAYAQVSPESTAPLAAAVPAISPSAGNGLVSFPSQFAPEVAVGFLDREGFRRFVGPGLEKLNAAPPPGRIGRSSPCRSPRTCSPNSAGGC